jgi:chaperonin GroES
MLVPVSDVLVLELVEREKSTLLIPDQVDQEKAEGAFFRVLAAGPGEWDHGKFIDNYAEEGDVVIISQYGTSKVEYKGKRVVIGRGRDVLLRVED